MHHAYRHRPIVRPRLFDAEVLEVVGKIGRAGRGEELGDGEFESVGEFFQVVHADMTFTEELMCQAGSPNVAEVRTTESGPRVQGGTGAVLTWPLSI